MIEQQQQISATRTEENRQIKAADPTETAQEGNNTALWFVFFGESFSLGCSSAVPEKDFLFANRKKE